LRVEHRARPRRLLRARQAVELDVLEVEQFLERTDAITFDRFADLLQHVRVDAVDRVTVRVRVDALEVPGKALFEPVRGIPRELEEHEPRDLTPQLRPRRIRSRLPCRDHFAIEVVVERQRADLRVLVARASTPIVVVRFVREHAQAQALVTLALQADVFTAGGGGRDGGGRDGQDGLALPADVSLAKVIPALVVVTSLSAGARRSVAQRTAESIGAW
jgi:hypothetical protein